MKWRNKVANSSGEGFLAGVILGGIAGFAVGVLLAPKPGSELRANLMDRADSAREQIWDRTGSAREQFMDNTGAAREQMEDLLDSTSQRLDEIRAEAAQIASGLRQRVGRNSSNEDDGMPVMAEFETAPPGEEQERV
jgi:gas vesicle protein